MYAYGIFSLNIYEQMFTLVQLHVQTIQYEFVLIGHLAGSENENGIIVCRYSTT